MAQDAKHFLSLTMGSLEFGACILSDCILSDISRVIHRLGAGDILTLKLKKLKFYALSEACTKFYIPINRTFKMI